MVSRKKIAKVANLFIMLEIELLHAVFSLMHCFSRVAYLFGDGCNDSCFLQARERLLQLVVW